MSLGKCPIARMALQNPSSVAIINHKQVYTYLDLDRLVQEVAAKIKGNHFILGGKVGFPAEKNLETILLFFALFRLGLTACPINPKLPGLTRSNLLDEMDASCFLDPKSLSPLFCTPKEIPLLLKETATMLATSGSSAKPKIACHTFENHLYSAQGFCKKISLQENDRWLLSLPLFHVSGISILFRCFIQGATVVISDENMEDIIAKQQITHLSLVATQLRRLVTTNAETSSLKTVLLGGGPIAPSLLQEASARIQGLMPTYGLTETSSLVTLETSPEISPLGVSLGNALPYRELTIKEDGEICVRGSILFQGYFDKEKGIILPLDKEGYFSTKDVGSIRGGKLYFIGRKDHMFISGGENIQPEEIENALYAIDKILLAFVVPKKDAEFGERPVAFIEHEETNFSPTEIQDKLRKVLPSYKVPKEFFAIPNSLKASGIKISRNHLKQLINSEH